MVSKQSWGWRVCPNVAGWKQVTSVTLGWCTLTFSVTAFGFEAQYWKIFYFHLPLSTVPRKIEHSVWGTLPFKKLLYSSCTKKHGGAALLNCALGEVIFTFYSAYFGFSPPDLLQFVFCIPPYKHSCISEILSILWWCLLAINTVI